MVSFSTNEYIIIITTLHFNILKDIGETLKNAISKARKMNEHSIELV